MATQQGAPSRPWFFRPPPPPPPIQQPDQAPIRPAFIRPAFTRAPQAVAPPPPPPPPNVVAPTSPPVARAPTIPNEPPPSGSAIATSPPSRVADSPAMKVPTMTRVSSSSSSSTISHPPSPLVLPSPQVKSYQPEYEQKKTVLVQETKEKPKHLEDDMGWRSRETSKTKHSDSEDVLPRMRIITIAGENKGAIMDLTPSDRKTVVHKFTGNINKKDDSPAMAIPTPNSASSDVDKSGSSNSDGSSRSKAKKKNQKSNSLPLMNSVMNSNVQGVNNSILYNCSTTHHDPGVHLSLSRKHKPDGGF